MATAAHAGQLKADTDTRYLNVSVSSVPYNAQHLSQEKEFTMATQRLKNEIVINGPPAKVFDVVTITRYWPLWHEMTRAVGGVTETPFQMGDKIYEFIRTPTGPSEFHWTVTECDRGRQCAITAQDGTVIRYYFKAVPEGTLFTREVNIAAVPTDPEFEALSVQRLKVLVEDVLWREGKSPTFDTADAKRAMKGAHLAA